MSKIRDCRAAVACLFTALAPTASPAVTILSEVFYDASGSDNGLSFVELYGAPGASLDGWTLEGVNGSNGAVTPSFGLSGAIGASGLFVVADDAGDGTSQVVGADLLRNFDFQNGPDSVVLRDADGLVRDALGYGVFGVDDVFAGEGSPAPDVAADQALARVFANVDTDDNLADFASAVPSPGTAPLAPVPEPSGVALLGLGLAGLARIGRV